MPPYDVAIAGLGPTGATLANLLAQCGLRVLVLEREAAAYHLPRAVHFDAEVMRVFQWVGIAEALDPLTALHPGMRFVDGQGATLLDWPRPQGIGPQGWRSNFRFHQPDLEKLLRDKLATYPNVTLRTRCDLFALTETDAGVELRFEDLATGRFETAHARYLVGADGARSLVRRVLASEMEDWGFNERWLVIDLLLKREMPELGDVSIQYCDAARGGTYVRGPFNRRRWELRLLPDEDGFEMARPENVWPLLSRWIAPEDADLERATTYTFNSRVAQKWQSARVFLAGDACHQTPPFMGQGMCAGIRDVANLYWKLVRVCKGQSTPALLASYESERRPNAVEYVQTAMRLGALINTAGSAEDLRAAIPQAGSNTMASIAPPLGAGLTAAGARLIAQPILADGTRSDDIALHQFVLLAQDAGQMAGLSLPDDIVTLTPDQAPQVADILGNAPMMFLRPDRYLLAQGDQNTIAHALTLVL